MSKRLEPGMPVLVFWVDSRGAENGWQDIPAVLEACEDDRIVTAGILLRKTKKAVVLCLSLDPGNGTVAGFISIPMVAVKKVKVLK